MEMLQKTSDMKPSLPGQDKGANWTDPFDDLFDHFVQTDQFQFSDHTNDPSSSDDLTNFFDVPTSPNGSDPFNTSSLPIWDGATSGDSTKNRAAEPCFIAQQRSASSGPSPGNEATIYPESRGRAAISDPELFSLRAAASANKLDSPKRNSPTPTSPTPAPRPVRPGAVANLSKALCRSGPVSVQKLRRKHGDISKMMRPSTYKPGYQDIWAKRMEAAAEKLNISVSTANNGLESPPPSAELFQTENGHGFHYSNDESNCFPVALGHDDVEVSPLSANFRNVGQYQITPLTSPAPDRDTHNICFEPRSHLIPDNDDYFTSPIPNEAIGFLETPPPSQRIPSNPWGQNTPTELDFSFHGWSTTGGGATAGADSSLTWPRSKDASSSQPCSGAPFSDLHAPTSSNDERAHAYGSLLPLDNHTEGMQNIDGQWGGDLATAGLMIQCGSDNNTSSAAPPHGHSTTPNVSGSHAFSPSPVLYSSAASSFTSQPRYNPSLASPPVLSGTFAQPPTSAYAHRPTASFSSASGLPSISSSLRQNRPSANRSRSANGRRKSTSAVSQGHARQGSNGSQATRGRHSGAAGSPSVGFVNFTALDSRKILGGVAPSGSSKTKARREKEAREDRRKLSQAAARAVMEAGGDLTRLEREGFLADY